MAKGTTMRRLRQGVLLYVLIMVAVSTWLARERSTDWNEPLWVAVFPINGDRSSVVGDYIERLAPRDFSQVEEFFTDRIAAHRRTDEAPVHIDLRAELKEQPPAPPNPPSAVRVMAWTLKMRYFAWRMQNSEPAVTPDIKMFVVYFDPATHPSLAHSLGLQKGLLGVVNAYADETLGGRNQVVMAHELMHTLGATDKYDPHTALPLHPDGYADPDASPLWPQTRAEIMGGRIPIAEDDAVMPNSLRHVEVGPATAREIRWSDAL